jgi:hypothetical protein
MMKAASTSETLVNFYQTTWRYNPEDSHLHIRRRENLKSHCTISVTRIGVEKRQVTDMSVRPWCYLFTIGAQSNKRVESRQVTDMSVRPWRCLFLIGAQSNKRVESRQVTDMSVRPWRCLFPIGAQSNKRVESRQVTDMSVRPWRFLFPIGTQSNKRVESCLSGHPSPSCKLASFLLITWRIIISFSVSLRPLFLEF